MTEQATDNRIDEIAQGVFETLGLTFPLPDRVVWLYQKVKALQCMLNPEQLSAEMYALIAILGTNGTFEEPDMEEYIAQPTGPETVEEVIPDPVVQEAPDEPAEAPLGDGWVRTEPKDVFVRYQGAEVLGRVWAEKGESRRIDIEIDGKESPVDLHKDAIVEE